eukprot:339299-Chlamydomonas_euryale.AAC.1
MDGGGNLLMDGRVHATPREASCNVCVGLACPCGWLAHAGGPQPPGVQRRDVHWRRKDTLQQ